MSYFHSATSAITQNVIAPSGWATTANIGAGSSWVSPVSDTLGVNAIQVLWLQDRNCTVYVDQSNTGTGNWVETPTGGFEAFANIGDGRTVQAVGSHARIRVKNTSATATTLVDTAGVLCPVADPMPIALSAEGNMRVGVYEIEGAMGTRVMVTPIQSLRVAESVRLAGSALFGPTGGASDALDTSFWVVSTGGSGSAVSTAGHAVLSTGATSASSVLVQSVRAARYVGTNSNYFRAVVQCPAAIGANVRRWGAGDALNGFFFEYDTSVPGLSVVCRKNGVDTKVTSGNYVNGTLGATYDPGTTSHVYEIHYTNSRLWFMVDGEMLHAYNDGTAPMSETLHLRVLIQNVNGANTNNNLLYARTASIARLGMLHTQNTFRNLTATGTYVLKSGPGSLARVVYNQTSNSASTVALYDNTTASGTLIATLSAQQQVNQSLPNLIEYDLPFSNGLTAVVSGWASPNITIVYE